MELQEMREVAEAWADEFAQDADAQEAFLEGMIQALIAVMVAEMVQVES